MSRTERAVKVDQHVTKTASNRESVEVAEAIKALQVQLADLRKIVQAAKSTGDIPAAKSDSRQ